MFVLGRWERSSTMLAIPLKLSPETDFAVLEKYLENHFLDASSGIDSATITDAVASLVAARNRALQYAKTPSNLKEARQATLDYATQIKHMQTKFPFGESKNVVQMTFLWADAFMPKKEVGQYSLNYELAGTLYNWAALHSVTGLQVDRNAPDYAPTSAKLFQQAAGIFNELKTKVCPVLKGAATSDLSLEGLQMIIDLMLAQAQALYYNKCLGTPAAKLTKGNEKMKCALCAKLAAHTKDLYAKALKVGTNSSLATVLSQVWINHMQFQQSVYASAAAYKQSEVVHANALATGTGFGMEIAYLIKAEEECKAAVEATKTKGSKLSAVDKSSVESLLLKIQAKRKEAEADNETVYCESIPAQDDLPAVVGKAMAKLIVPPECPTVAASGHGQDIFRKMVPKVVRQAGKRYEERLSALLTRVETECAARTRSARQGLGELGLPASIEAQIQSVGLPDSVWGKVCGVHVDKGGVASLYAALAAQEQAAVQARGILASVRGMLDEEERADEERRAGDVTRWSALPPSKLVNVDLRTDVYKYNKLLTDVGPSDAYVRKLLEDSAELLKVLLQSREEIGAKMPPMTIDTVVAANPVRQALVGTLKKLNAVVEERAQLVCEFKHALRSDGGPTGGIMPSLMQAGCGTSADQHNEWTDAHEASLFDFQIQKFQPMQEVIADNCAQQEELMKTIRMLNDKFHAVKADDANTKLRELLFEGIDKAVNTFFDLEAKVQSGKSFYEDVLTHLNELATTTREFCTDRKKAVDAHVYNPPPPAYTEPPALALPTACDVPPEYTPSAPSYEAPPANVCPPASLFPPAYPPVGYEAPPLFPPAYPAPSAYEVPPTTTTPSYGVSPANSVPTLPSYDAVPPSYDAAPPSYDAAPPSYEAPPSY